MTNRVNTIRWQPPAGVPVKQTGVYLLHGNGEHAARYEKLAERLTQAGYRVGAHDHPGHGKSSGKRGIIDPPGALVTQAAIQCQQFATEIGSAPVLFGHSMGGLTATELVLSHNLPVAGLMLSAPAFRPFMRKRDWLKVKVLAHLAPIYTVSRPYTANRLTHDEAMRVQAESDPLNHGFISASVVNWLMTSGETQIERASELLVDTLMLIAGEDTVVDSSAAKEFADAAPADKLTLHWYEQSRHEILNESNEIAEPAYQDIDQWLLARGYD